MWPAGCTTILDVSWELCLAVEHGLRVLFWQENYFGEDMPPEWMWPYPEELELHFEGVDSRRGSGASEPEEEDWDQNELTRELRRG